MATAGDPVESCGFTTNSNPVYYTFTACDNGTIDVTGTGTTSTINGSATLTGGSVTVEDGVKAMPKLKRLGGTCPCSKSVRWVMEDHDGTETTVMTRPA